MFITLLAMDIITYMVCSFADQTYRIGNVTLLHFNFLRVRLKFSREV